MKFETGNLALLVSNKISKTNREFHTVTKIMILSCKLNRRTERSDSCQAERDKIFENKAKLAFVRSRRRWLEQSEKYTKYFFQFRKKKF